LFTNEVLEHEFKIRGRAPIVVGGITIRITITITIGRRIRPIIVAIKVVPIRTIVEIIISNEVSSAFTCLMIIGELAAGVRILLEKGPSRHHISEDQQF
jgi:hypothetical protein